MKNLHAALPLVNMEYLTSGYISRLCMRLSTTSLNIGSSWNSVKRITFLAVNLIDVFMSTRVPRNCIIKRLIINNINIYFLGLPLHQEPT